jgi:hypothetical protein
MDIFTKPGTIIKIQLLQGSQARNYFESKERLFLQTVLAKIENDTSNDLNISDDEKNMLSVIFKKYNKYL